MQKQTKRLNVLLSVLAGLVIVTSLVMATMPKPEEQVIPQGPRYHQDVVMLGVRASKFAGMTLYMDSPNVILNKNENLQLTDDQRIRLLEIRDRARQEAMAVLTPEQQAQIAPSAAKPFVFDELDRRIPTCSDPTGGCGVPVSGCSSGCGDSTTTPLQATQAAGAGCCPHLAGK